MKSIIFFYLIFSSLLFANESLLEKNRKILILGDSITQGGTYVTNFETWLVKRFPDRRYTVINAGVGSETISGLSEKNHANGKFPRPSLFERLERVLAKTNPDLIISCYGMNCGIYKPLDKYRFDRYKNGQLRLRAAAKQYGAEILHVTPPMFDNHGKKGFNYNSVLTAYSAWLVKQRKIGWNVADLHTEMQKKIVSEKKKNSKFTVQVDQVHPNTRGHWMMAQSLISYFGDKNSAALPNASLLLKNKQRDNALQLRMLTYQKAINAETKPLRPGVPAGGNLHSAAQKAKQLEAIIYK